MTDVRLERTLRLIGSEALEKIINSKVAVFGIGGVGSYAAEAICRAGVSEMTFIDADTVDMTNINRQLVALTSTVGRYKAEVMAERAMDINPSGHFTALNFFYNADTQDSIDLTRFDYVVDAIDSVYSKLLLVENCVKQGVRIISSMGAGNKLDGTMFEITDISKTSVCPLARVMRQELRKRGITHLPVVYSKEIPSPPVDGQKLPASISFVPSAAGLAIAGKVIRDLAGL